MVTDNYVFFPVVFIWKMAMQTPETKTQTLFNHLNCRDWASLSPPGNIAFTAVYAIWPWCFSLYIFFWVGKLFVETKKLFCNLNQEKCSFLLHRNWIPIHFGSFALNVQGAGWQSDHVSPETPWATRVNGSTASESTRLASRSSPQSDQPLSYTG